MPAPQRKIGQEPEFPSGVTEGVDSCELLQGFFLDRMERRVYVKNRYDIGRMGGKRLLTALNRAIYTTLRDCIDVNVGEQAKDLLRQEHQRN